MRNHPLAGNPKAGRNHPQVGNPKVGRNHPQVGNPKVVHNHPLVDNPFNHRRATLKVRAVPEITVNIPMMRPAEKTIPTECA